MITPGFRGELISASFVQSVLPTLPGISSPPADIVGGLERWAERCLTAFGPTASPRTIADAMVVPLLSLLGFNCRRVHEGVDMVRIEASSGRAVRVPVVVVAWGVDLARAWRMTVLTGIDADARWCVCANGVAVRVCDTHRTWSRAFTEIDVSTIGESAEAQLVVWNTLSAEAWETMPSRLDQIAGLSSRHGIAVCHTLGAGVLSALVRLMEAFTSRGAGRLSRDQLFEQALTVIYRVLFLLFAEARGLVPLWHPVYRDRYSIDGIVQALLAGRGCRGLWATLQAISRLAHAGCRTGTLRVTAFNGRLFSPAHSAVLEHWRGDDRVLAETVLEVSTAPGRSGRSRIAFGDLSVERLGAVYEQVLEYRPSDERRGPLVRNRDTRKTTGTFYTPRQVTAHLVRETLTPLVAGRSMEQLLSLRVLDPAMGSGAFLVAACRFLAHAAEEALVAEGRWHPGDIQPEDRAGLRRTIAQRCLYGVDLNPVAVQLARLSIWLATLSAGKPLSFLDHHLVIGNSLIGATADDVARQPGATARSRRASALPLFADDAWDGVAADAGRAWLALAGRPDDSAEVVRDKERTLARLQAPDAPLGRWKQLLDLWCSGWFRPRSSRLTAAMFSDLSGYVLRGTCSLPRLEAERLVAEARATSLALGFLHWPLTFPEVFTGEAHGFDAIVGNPPWDMVRGDSGEGVMRERRREAAACLGAFVRESGVYRVQSRAHLNQYALFTERVLQLLKSGGRLGLIVPAGLTSDIGTSPLRRLLFDRTRVDGITGLDNRKGIFPIHRSVRFVLLTATSGTPTEAIACRFGLTDPEELERPASQTCSPLVLSRPLLGRISGHDDLGVPELLGAEDLEIVEDITARLPCLADPDGWHLRFGRELNATDDRRWFVPRSDPRAGRAVLEGKQLTPFRVDRGRSTQALGPGLLRQFPRRSRLAYRDVASATNRLTLIAAIVPAGAVTTHTLCCLKTTLPMDAQQVLCALLNSFVANYLVRLRVGTHVTASLVSKLRVPVLDPRSAPFTRLASLSRTLASVTTPVEAMAEYVELQALAAYCYQLTPKALAHVLGRFPLVPAAIRESVLTKFAAERTASQR